MFWCLLFSEICSFCPFLGVLSAFEVFAEGRAEGKGERGKVKSKVCFAQGLFYEIDGTNGEDRENKEFKELRELRELRELGNLGNLGKDYH